MPPIPSFPNSFDSEHAEYERILAYFKKDQKTDPIVLDRLNIEQMFVLIEGVLPIEACLYYQVLPLFLEGSRLHLGMVAPDDKAASDYVRRIVSYLNYSLVTWEISSEALKASLSAYLRHADQFSALSKQQPSAASRRANRLNRNQAPRQKKVDTANHPTLVVDSPDAIEPSLEEIIQSAPDPADTPISPQQTSDTASQQTDPQPIEVPEGESSASSLMAETDLEATQVISREDSAANAVVDSEATPEAELESEPESEPESPAARQADVGTDDPATQDPHPPIEILAQGSTSTTQPEDSDTTALGAPESGESSDVVLDRAAEPRPFSNPPQNDAELPISINLEESFSPDRLSQVNGMEPKTLLQKLLARVLDQGIGRLYFEQRGQVGRILWSENGVLQSIVDNITPLQFRGVISELKGMTHLPLAPSSQSCQVDLERIYQDERILLRFRFIPTELGEEATLQVLRGAALRFYQQQQLSRIGRDALTIAQALESKVIELRDRSRSAQGLSDHQAKLLPKLTQMIHDIETQINALNLPSEQSPNLPPDLLGDRSSDDSSP